MTRCAFDNRIVIRHARFLRGSRNAVHIADEPDHRLARSVSGDPRRGDFRDPTLYLETILLQNAGHVTRGLVLLESQLGVAENLIDHLLRKYLARLDGRNCLLLQIVDRGLGLAEEG